MRAHRITGNGDIGITGMQSGAARGRWRWIVDPIYAASETGLGNKEYNRSLVIFMSLSTKEPMELLSLS